MTTLKPGDKAPHFTNLNQDEQPVSLTDFAGQRVVLFFYPKASTPGCTAEACNLRDNIDRFRESGTVILGASADTPKAQKKFQEKYELPYDLLADTEHELLKAYGVWGPKKFMGREYDGIHRTTFVIDEQGVIADVITDVKTKDHAAQLL